MVGRVDEYVPGLDVAVDEPTLVRGVEGVRDLADEPDRPLPRKRPVGEQGAKVGSGHEPGREEELAVRLARRVDREDAGVVDRRGQPRLAQEPLSERVVAGELGCDQLQRDRPVERELGRAVDDAHPAAADDAFDPVAGELGSYLGHVEVRFSTVRSTM